MSTFKVNHGGVWKDPTPSVHHAGIWKDVKEQWKNVDGTWKSVYTSVKTYTFTSSLLLQTNLLSSFVDPNSSDVFEITINAGVTLSGPKGSTGSTGSNGTNGIGHPTGYPGGTGGAGGYVLDLNGFSGKTITFINNGTIIGGAGGTGGRGGNAGKWGSGTSTTYYSGGAGGNGGGGAWPFKNTSGVTKSVTINSTQRGSTGSTGANGTSGWYKYTDIPNSCFTAGQTVHMADGTLKFIEDVLVGEFVLDGYKQPQEVLYYDRPLRGDRTVYAVNDRLFTTEEHPIMQGDRKGFTVISMDAWRYDKSVIHTVYDGDMNPVPMPVVSSTEGRTSIIPIKTGNSIATFEGQQIINSVHDSGKQDEQLYNLVVAGSGTYHVNGVVVSGHSNDERFDYVKGELR